jgi:hypothetical protein
MPPGQPILRCQDCGLLRPCKNWPDGWLCVECSPLSPSETDDSAEPDHVAADGGDQS